MQIQPYRLSKSSSPRPDHPVLREVTAWSRSALRGTAEAARWVELDETAAVLLGNPYHPAVTALSVLDGLVTASDGLQLYREGRNRGDRGAKYGGLVRVALGLGGIAPGLAGCASEIASGVYCAAEGVVRHDPMTTVTGLTQFGVSGGLALSILGVGGHLGAALVLGCGAARIGYYLRHLGEDTTVAGRQSHWP